MPRPIRVVIVDDSNLMRQMLTATLSKDLGIEIVGTAADPFEAREIIKSTNPDVLTLDIEMPKMDGLSFLEKIMTLRPMPVVMVSSLTQSGSNATIRALELGAVDYVGKPAGSEGFAFQRVADELIAKIKLAATARVSRPRPSVPQPATLAAPRRGGSKAFIAIGASTGGVERIRDILQVMPANCPPIVITQHMGPSYLASFAERLNKLCSPTIKLGSQGARLQQGVVYIAPGEGHLAVARDAAGYFCQIQDQPPLVSGHRPSVDVLFHSVAKAAGPNVVAAILSGMGRDGANGMAAIRAAGAHTIGEQESSCVVYGMPKMAKEAGGIVLELPLAQIAPELLRAVDAAADRPRAG